MVGVIKNIFVDNWDEFEQLNRGNIRSVVYKEIKKMLNCDSLDIGYIEFKCTCGEIKKVGFRCKSRFCTSCRKKKALRQE